MRREMVANAAALPATWGVTHRDTDETTGLLKRQFRSFDESVALRMWERQHLATRQPYGRNAL
jgi:hypothetical protein